MRPIAQLCAHMARLMASPCAPARSPRNLSNLRFGALFTDAPIHWISQPPLGQVPAQNARHDGDNRAGNRYGKRD